MTGDVYSAGRTVAAAVATALSILLDVVLLDLHAATRPAEHTASLGGTVVLDEPQRRPLRQAIVTLNGDVATREHTTTTDDNGRFLFRDLPIGNYTVRASRPGYVTGYYGALEPGRGPGSPIAVLEGQQLEQVTVSVLRGAVIAGAVRNEMGRGVPGMSVQVLRERVFNRERRFEFAKAAVSTDDRGEYRVYGLAPGRYVIGVPAAASVRQTLGGPEEIGFSVGQDIAARIRGDGDVRRVTEDELSWAAAASLRGGVAAGPSGLALAPEPRVGRNVAYAPIYFPGTPNVEAATVLSLEQGQELVCVDLTRTLVNSSRVSGGVFDSSGLPVPGVFISLRRGTPDPVDPFAGRASARSGLDGRFMISSVTPGSYTLSCRVGPSLLPGEPQTTAIRWASANVAVTGDDISNLRLILQPAMTVSGTVRLQDHGAQGRQTNKGLRIAITPLVEVANQAASAPTLMNALYANVEADGSFTINDVTPGRYRVSTLVSSSGRASADGSNWVLNTAVLNGRDVADLPFMVTGTDSIVNLEVTVTPSLSELEGALTDLAGRPVTYYPVVVFPTDTRYWSSPSRRAQQVKPTSDGHYRIAGLPAGDYYVCAVTQLGASDLNDPSLLAMLVKGAFVVRLNDGEKRRQDIRFVSPR